VQGLFVEFGEIVMTKVVTDRSTKKSLGYGFVKFAREDDARMAIQRLNGFTIDHKCLKVSVARPPSLEIRNCKLYITNLPKDYSENDVIGLFREVSTLHLSPRLPCNIF
jgi:RNA recognition motif-containing protein